MFAFGMWASFVVIKCLFMEDSLSVSVARFVYVAITVATAMALEDTEHFRKYAFVSAALASCVAIYGFAVGIENAYMPRSEFAVVLDRNIQGWCLVFGFLPLLAYAVISPVAGPWTRVLAAMSSVICALCALGYSTRSGSVSCAIGVLCIFARRLTTKTILALVLLVMIIGGLALKFELWDAYMARWDENNVRTAGGRTEYVESMFTAYLKLPLFQQLFGGYESAPVVLGRQESTARLGTHNGYLTLLLENGAVGLFVFLTIIYILLKKCLHSSSWTGIAILSTSCAFLVTLLTLDLLNSLSGWIAMGILLTMWKPISHRIKPNRPLC